MTEIRIETGFARQLVLSGEAVALILRDLEAAISDVDDPECQQIASQQLAEVLGRLAGVARRWEELGARLHAVADAFKEADHAGVPACWSRGRG